MSQATLKRSLGEAAAFIDDSHGENRLYDVLKALSESAGETLNVQQAVIATGVLAGLVVDVATKLSSLCVAVGTTGTAGATTVKARIDGTAVGDGVTIDNTDADGSTGVELLSALDTADLPAGTLVEIEVTAAPTAGADLTASLRLRPVTVEA